MFCIGLYTSIYGQSLNSTPSDARVDIEELPAVVIRNVGNDFSVYLPARKPEVVDPRVKLLENQFISYNLGKDYEGYDSYLVIMETEKGILTATYNEKGILKSVIEKYENSALPSTIMYSVYKNYPGWTIVDDKFEYHQEKGDITKKDYTLKIKKGSDKKTLVFNPNGDIVSRD